MEGKNGADEWGDDVELEPQWAWGYEGGEEIQPLQQKVKQSLMEMLKGKHDLQKGQ